MNLAVIGLLVAVVSLAMAFVVHAVIVARWSARLQTLVEIHAAEITSLRVSRHEHANRLGALEGRLSEHTESERE